MSELEKHAAAHPEAGSDGPDHDAAPDGPGVNAPGDAPDRDSPTQAEHGDAGRLDADDL